MTTLSNTKPYDVVVYGATGFTGMLVAQYLITQSESSPDNESALRWAIAGRNKKKLEAVKKDLRAFAPSMTDAAMDRIGVLVADSSDAAAIDEMVRQTKVVATLAGPYAKYGTLLLKACAEQGVHYCDLTGELVWVDEMLATYHSVAERTGARIVHCCGFESIPSDMTTFVVADAIVKKHQTPPAEVSMFFRDSKGGVSGGTCASMFNMFETSSNKKIKELSNPFFLTDAATREKKAAAGTVGPNQTAASMKYEKDLKSWSSIFLGGALNMTIVHRTNYLLKDYYGDRFVYRERFALGNVFTQAVITVGTVLLSIMVYFSWTRALLKLVAPSPGQGPSEEMRKNGYFTATALGYLPGNQLAVRASVRGVGDPGYLLTSKMITESAICLAKGEFNPQSPAATKGGFYTPASAFGHALVKRLHEKQLMLIDLEEL